MRLPPSDQEKLLLAVDGVPEMLDEVQVEATSPDGPRLVTRHRPTA